MRNQEHSTTRPTKQQFEARPAHLNRFEWRKLLRSLLAHPDKDVEYIKSDKTGEYSRVIASQH